jgi:hypothetical protein
MLSDGVAELMGPWHHGSPAVAPWIRTLETKFRDHRDKSIIPSGEMRRVEFAMMRVKCDRYMSWLSPERC